MSFHKLFKKIIKNEQLRLPLEDAEQEAQEQNIDPEVFKKSNLQVLANYLDRRGRTLSPEELYQFITTDNHNLTDTWKKAQLINNESLAHPEVVGDVFNKIKSKEGMQEFANIMVRQGDLPNHIFDQLIDDKQHAEAVSLNNNIKLQHAHKIIEKHPKYAVNVMDQFAEADDGKAYKKALEAALPHMQYSDFRRALGHLHNSATEIHPNLASKILNSKFGNHIENPEHYDMLLGATSEPERKKFIDSRLGIEGGEHDDPEIAQNPENNFQNWKNGPNHDARAAAYLAKSKYLDDSHAEHIKRHGSFGDRWSLYHENPHIDPRHGVEMFKKWRDDEDYHGYDAQELNEYNADHRPIYNHTHLSEEDRQDILDEGMEQIDEAANSAFSYSDYLSNISVDEALEIMGDSEDDHDEISDKLREDHDWVAENKNSKQNVGRLDYDSLDKLAQKFDPSEAIDIEDFQEVTGLQHPSELNLPYDEKRGWVDAEDVHSEIEKFGGPSVVNYADHHSLELDDHPEYQDRLAETQKEWRLNHWQENMYDIADRKHLYENHREHPDYQEAWEDAKREYLAENSQDAIQKLYENSHKNHEFIPNHLIPHLPEYAELKEAAERNLRDKGQGEFLDKHIKNREYDHSYGEGLHHHELAKDYANAKGGAIDIGTLHKVFPNQKETWKKMFGSKGKLSSEEIQQKIDEIPKTKYNITYSKWGQNQIQNTNGQDEVVVRLDHSPESLAEIEKNPEVYETFKKIQQLSQRSGHPTNDNTIAWARVDFTDPKKPFISELQSDYGKTVRQYLKDNDEPEKAEHVQVIENHHKNWRENLLNFVLKTAKKHGAEKVYTHSPESKAKHTGEDTIHSVYHDSYGKVPKSMGFKPVDIKEMPLTAGGKEHFTLREAEFPQEKAQDHIHAAGYHHAIHSLLPADSEFAQYHREMADNHHKKAQELHPEGSAFVVPFGDDEEFFYKNPLPTPIINDTHRSDARDIPFTGKTAFHPMDSKLNTPLKEAKYLQGHTYDLNPSELKKSIDLADTLIKAEALLVKKYMEKQDLAKASFNVRHIQKLLGYDNL